jgi:hypothetical protein
LFKETWNEDYGQAARIQRKEKDEKKNLHLFLFLRQKKNEINANIARCCYCVRDRGLLSVLYTRFSIIYYFIHFPRSRIRIAVRRVAIFHRRN